MAGLACHSLRGLTRLAAVGGLRDNEPPRLKPGRSPDNQLEMSTIGHIAVGMMAARSANTEQSPGWPSMAWWSIVSLLPDADVIGFPLGVEYGAPWGHRGATHSLAFSIGLGLTIGSVVGRWTSRRWRTAVLTSAVLASHGLLDTMTYGGLGCALLWPFDLVRYSAPWQPIAAAPIGLDLLSARGLWVALTETALFAPVLVFSWSRRSLRHSQAAEAARNAVASRRPLRTRISLVALWAVTVWLIASSDPVRDAIIGFVLREDTAYARAIIQTKPFVESEKASRQAS